MINKWKNNKENRKLTFYTLKTLKNAAFIIEIYISTILLLHITLIFKYRRYLKLKPNLKNFLSQLIYHSTLALFVSLTLYSKHAW